MEVGLRGNRAVVLQQFISQGDHTLRPGFEFWITGTANLWIPATAPSDSRILINNATTNALTITANGGTPIFGVARSTGAALPGGDRVRILPGQQASFVMGDRGWFAQGCEQNSLVFTYNGTPLAGSPSNPGGASDLMHWLGIQAGGGSWVNPAGTSWLTAVASSESGGWGTASVLSNRAANSGDLAQHLLTNTGSNGWCAWQLRSGHTFRPTGVLYLWNNTNGPFATSFEVKAANGTTLTTTTSVTEWETVRSVAGLTGSNGAWQFYSLTSSNFYSQFGIRNSASSGELRISYQEFCWFGELLFS